MTFSLPGALCYLLQIPRFVISIKETAFQPHPTIHTTNVQLRAKFHRLACFSPYNRTNERLAHTDDQVRHAVRSVIVHVLLLLIDGAEHVQTFHLLRGQGFTKMQFVINDLEVTPEIGHLFANCLAGLLCSMLTASCALQVVFAGAFTVCSQFLPICRLMKSVLNDAEAQIHPQRLGNIVLSVGQQSGVALLFLQLGNRLCFLYQTVVLFQVKPTGCLKSIRLFVRCYNDT